METFDQPKTGKFFTPKIIFVILAAVVLVEVVFAIRTLSAPTPKAVVKSKVPLKSQVSLVSVKKEYIVKDVVPVSVMVETGNHKTIGTDVIFHYDPKILEATSSAVIVKGKIYQDYPAAGIDSQTGTVTISGINSSSQPNFQGSGLLATINFRAKAAGQTTVTLDFTPDSTTDTNMVDSTSGEDVLESVENLSLTIR